MTKNTTRDERIKTGVRNLDALLAGGVPRGSVTVIGGAPGSGKTILTQQICFHNASAEQRVLYFSTLSEPTAKLLRNLGQFSYFDSAKMDAAVQFVDLGGVLRDNGLAETSKLIMEEIKRTKPAIVVIDSFKAFDDLASSREELRKFGYELAVHLMAWEATTFLLGEYGQVDFQSNPLFSIVDALLMVSQREDSGEQQRFLQVSKMRGTRHSRDEHSFVITDDGIEVFAPRVTIKREDRGSGERCKTGILKLDELLGEGIPQGSSLLISGVAGTGKTALLLEFLYRGAQAGEKGVVFTFEETAERLRAAARGLGWEFDQQIDKGMIEIVFTPQPDIMVERDLLMMRERIEASGARRVAVDSVSVFLDKVKQAEACREKVFQLASIVQNAQAVGFFATDIPYGSNQLSRRGVEETVVDGVIVLSSKEEGLERKRYIEVYKLRNTAHLKGGHDMMIGPGGMTIFPRYSLEAAVAPPPPIETGRRLASGVAGLDALCGGGLLARSVTLVSGSPGVGKSTLGLQFVAEGVKRSEPALYISLEEGPAQIQRTAEELGVSLPAASNDGLLEILYLSRDNVRASQFLAILVDKIRRNKVERLVLDSVSQLVGGGPMPEEQRKVLFGLVQQFKGLGVTTLLTLESQAMHSTDVITDHDLSAVADNILLLRYAKTAGELRPTLAVVKTRGSAHDWGTYYYAIGKGGISVGDRIDRAVKGSGSP